MNKTNEFKKECIDRIEKQGNNNNLLDSATRFMEESIASGYSYNFSWMGRPVMQYPQDIIALQEIIWKVKPDLIIETGIAHGGSLIFSASMLELIGKGEVLGIDIDIREHNRIEIENHPMVKRITIIQGSSIDEDVIDQVKKIVEGKKTVLVCLDSNHTHTHVLKELELYSPFVTLNSYLIAYDGIVEFIPEKFNPTERPWGIGDNPYTAVKEFLKTHTEFVSDNSIDKKILLSVAPAGYLKRIK